MSVQYATTEQAAKFSAARAFTSISEMTIIYCNYYILLPTSKHRRGLCSRAGGAVVLAERYLH